MMKPDRGSNWTNTNTNTSPVRSTLNTLLLVEADQLLRVELLPTAATHVRLWEEDVKVCVQVALLVKSIPMRKDLVGEGMSCKTFFVFAILRKENWVLSTSKVPELLKNISELWKNDKPDHIENILDPSDRAGSGHGSPDVEYAFVLFSRFSDEARNLDETTIFERPFYLWLVDWLIAKGVQRTKEPNSPLRPRCR